MKNIRNLSMARGLAWVLTGLLAAPPNALPAAPSQAPGEQAPVAKLNLVVVKGEGAINNIKQRTAREVVVQVEDENRKPVAGAAVVFLLPNSGPGASFADGGKLYTAITDQNGRASVSSLKPNQSAGSYELNVNVSYQGLRASGVVHMSNILPTTIAGMSVGVFVAVVVAAAAAGIVLGVNAASGDNTPSNSAKVTIGQPSLP